jgi:hypothetical protein
MAVFNILGYAIEAECYNLNRNNKSRDEFSHELANIPVEIIVDNCSNLIKIDRVKLDGSYLNFDVDFKVNLTAVRYFLYLNVFINRRYGNGCRANVIMYPQVGSVFSLSSFLKRNYDRFSTSDMSFANFWKSLTLSDMCVYVFVLSIVLILFVLTTVAVVRVKRRKTNNRDITVVDNTFSNLTRIQSTAAHVLK